MFWGKKVRKFGCPISQFTDLQNLFIRLETGAKTSRTDLSSRGVRPTRRYQQLVYGKSLPHSNLCSLNVSTCGGVFADCSCLVPLLMSKFNKPTEQIKTSRE